MKCEYEVFDGLAQETIAIIRPKSSHPKHTQQAFMEAHSCRETELAYRNVLDNAIVVRKELLRITRKDLPTWAKSVIVHANGIDGDPPRITGVYGIAKALRLFDTWRQTKGGGEWDVLCYAADQTSRTIVVESQWPTEVHIHGPTNSYTVYRTNKKCRVQLVEKWSYMDVP